MEITLRINDSDVIEFSAGFLASTPIPKNAQGQPLYTAERWLKKWIIQRLISKYNAGKTTLAQGVPVIQVLRFEEP